MWKHLGQAGKRVGSGALQEGQLVGCGDERGDEERKARKGVSLGHAERTRCRRSASNNGINFGNPQTDRQAGSCVPDVIHCLSVQVSGPNSSDATMHTELAEPPPLRSEDASAIDLARKRLTKNKRFPLTRLPNLRSLWAGRRSRALRDQPTLSDDSSFAEIDLNVNDSFDDLNVHEDIYKWAVVYENQRGCAHCPHHIYNILRTLMVLQNHYFFNAILLPSGITSA